MTSRGQAEITITEMPAGRSEAPFDAGEIAAYYSAPLRVGDAAPPIEASTLEGKRLSLADYKGKYVLINFWRSDVPESQQEMESLKAAHTAWNKEDRLVLVGFSFDDTPAAAQKYATENGLTWAQCFLGKVSDVPMRYRLRRPTTLLVGPDGLILRPQLTGPGIASALEEALGAK